MAFLILLLFFIAISIAAAIERHTNKLDPISDEELRTILQSRPITNTESVTKRTLEQFVYTQLRELEGRHGTHLEMCPRTISVLKQGADRFVIIITYETLQRTTMCVRIDANTVTVSHSETQIL